MITGKHPWAEYNDDLKQLLTRIATTTTGPAYPQTVSPELKDFLTQCFIIDKAKRPSAVKLLEHPFVQNISELDNANMMKEMTAAMKGNLIRNQRRCPKRRNICQCCKSSTKIVLILITQKSKIFIFYLWESSFPLFDLSNLINNYN